MENEPEVVLILLGRCGSGKSTLANTLSKTTQFKSNRSISAVTYYCQSALCTLENGRKLLIVDTPGLGDTSREQEEIHIEIKKNFDRLKEQYKNSKFCLGLVVGAQSRVVENDLKEFGELGGIFGLRFYDHSLLFWTHIDLLSENKTILEGFNTYISEADQSITDFVGDVKGGQILVSNVESGTICDLFTNEIKSKTELIKFVSNRIFNSDLACVGSELVLRGKKARRLRQRKFKEEENKSLTEYLTGSFTPMYKLFSDMFVSDKKE